ncbi:glycosyltransferase [Candidatus Kaiserbacteria bacterium]|nr:glycosyltransferase [Candidatus Kaiserbacteria bacterium]
MNPEGYPTPTKPPVISVVIPARDEEEDIERTILQFKALTLPHEVIVSDGKSTDATTVRAKAAGAQVVLNSDNTRTAAKQRNDGAKIARGEFIVFIDTTVMLPEINSFFTCALTLFKNDSSLVGLSAPQWIQPHLETSADRFFLTLINWLLRFQNNTLKKGAASGKFQMIRREAFEKAGGYPEKLVTGEDHEMFVQLTKIGRTHTERSLYIYYDGRREHAWGWPKLLWYWIRDTVAIAATGKSASADWAPVSKTSV